MTNNMFDFQLPPEILFDIHMQDLKAAFRRGEWIENLLFPVDHTSALEFKQRTKTEPLGAKYAVEMEKAIALWRAVKQSNVRIAAIAYSKKGAEGFEHADLEWMSFSEMKKRKLARRAHESLALAAKIVGGKSGNKNCSPAAKAHRGEQLKAQDEWLKKQVAFNKKTGKYFRLAGTQEKRKNRLAEMFSMMKGMEKLIKTDVLQWSACVVTAPPHMHPNPLKGSCSWDGTLPHEVAKWLSDGWALIRARLAKAGITLSGGWFRESNQDSTPHINFFLLFNVGDYRKVEKAFREVFGHSKRAIRMMLGEDQRAVAALAKKGKKPANFASYAMKYFTKGMNGWGSDDTADAEETTASTFAYRRYGFFGLPSISTWRELRRLKECPQNSIRLAAAWRAAHRGDAADWIMQCGGLACKRSLRPLQPLRVVVEGCKATQVTGVIEINNKFSGNEHVTTRTPQIWEIVSIKSLVMKIINKKSVIKHKVTVRVNYPRRAANTKLINNISNKTTPKIQTFPIPERLFASNKLIHDSRLNN